MSRYFIPFLPFRLDRQSRRVLQGLFPIASRMSKLFPGLRHELEESGNAVNATEYMAGALLSSMFYFVMIIMCLTLALRAAGLEYGPKPEIVIFVSLAFSTSAFVFILLHPKLLMARAVKNIERNLLYATRHLMIQTTAGVPLFESIVSVSEHYGDQRLDYGAISVEFGKIVKEVRGGKELTQALEDSATRVNSNQYRRLIWQLANSNKAGANIGFVLRQMMEYLADEQRVMIRDYGSQLSPLAIFYMLACIIAPTMGMIFLVIISTLVSFDINEVVLGGILGLVMVAQLLFVGLIKSKRPMVAI